MTDYRDFIYKVIGDKIKSKREELKMSQLELSENLNISRSSISNIEVGRHQVPLYILYEISQVMGIDIKELIPTHKEVMEISVSSKNDYSSYLGENDFNAKQIKSIQNSINKI